LVENIRWRISSQPTNEIEFLNTKKKNYIEFAIMSLLVEP